MVLATVEGIDQDRHRKAAATQRAADDQIPGHPDPPRIAGAEMGHRAEAENEPLEQEEAADQHQQPEHQGERRDKRASAQSIRMATPQNGRASSRERVWHYV